MPYFTLCRKIVPEMRVPGLSDDSEPPGSDLADLDGSADHCSNPQPASDRQRAADGPGKDPSHFNDFITKPLGSLKNSFFSG